MFDVAESWGALSDTEKIVYPLVSAGLLAVSGLCSGMTIGIFSIDIVDMQVMVSAGTAAERRRARRLLPLLAHPNQTLVALLVMNTFMMTALPVMLDRMVGEALALVLSVTMLLFFGEVVPQATFVRHNVAMCALFSPLVWVSGVLTFPVTFTLSKVLDCTVGVDVNEASKETLEQAVTRALLDAEKEADLLAADHHAGGSNLAPLEMRVLLGALRMSTRTVGEAIRIVPPQEAFMLEATHRLTAGTLDRILAAQYNRIPVFLGSRSQVVGVLLVKSIVSLAFKRTEPLVLDLPLREPMRINSDCTVLDAYRAFQTGQCHLAAVYGRTGILVGFATLEDVFDLLHGDADEGPRESQSQFATGSGERLGVIQQQQSPNTSSYLVRRE